MSGNRIVANQVQDKGLSFLRKQESRHVNIPGFRIKCGMTTQKPNSRIYTLTIRANLRNPRLEIDSIIHPYFAKQSQFSDGWD